MGEPKSRRSEYRKAVSVKDSWSIVKSSWILSDGSVRKLGDTWIVGCLEGVTARHTVQGATTATVTWSS